MTDIHAQRPLRDHAVYCMAKAALEMATKSLALELAPHVRVNAIAPGAILWPEDDSGDERRAALLARTPLARTGTPEEVAEARSEAHPSELQSLMRISYAVFCLKQNEEKHQNAQ